MYWNIKILTSNSKGFENSGLLNDQLITSMLWIKFIHAPIPCVGSHLFHEYYIRCCSRVNILNISSPMLSQLFVRINTYTNEFLFIYIAFIKL